VDHAQGPLRIPAKVTDDSPERDRHSGATWRSAHCLSAAGVPCWRWLSRSSCSARITCSTNTRAPSCR